MFTGPDYRPLLPFLQAIILPAEVLSCRPGDGDSLILACDGHDSWPVTISIRLELPPQSKVLCRASPFGGSFFDQIQAGTGIHWRVFFFHGA
jgi:hypothetical protein